MASSEPILPSKTSPGGGAEPLSLTLSLALARAPLREIDRIAAAGAALVPRFADACAVELSDETGSVTRHSFRRNAGASGDGHPALTLALRARGAVLGALVLVGPSHELVSDPALASAMADQVALALHDARSFETARLAARDREDLLAIVAHDLKNPLGAIRMITSMLSRGADGFDPVRASRCADRIDHAAARMTALVHDLLEVACIDAGRLKVKLEPLDAPTPVADAVDLLRPLAAEKSVALELDVPELDGVRVRGDHERLVQAFSNLLGNALQFSPERSSVTAGGRRDGDFVRYFVEDRGPGISPADLPRVFDRFWQARAHGTASVGLGLTIARAIVDAHAGRIWVESTPGHGATFFFTVPVL